MRFIRPIPRRKLVLTGGVCVALGIVGIVPWQAVAQEPPANRILFVSNREEPHRFRIFAMDPDGSHIVRLTQGDFPESEVVDGPDGKPTLRPAASHRNAMELDPVWSPDGKRIAFTFAVSEKPEPGSKVKMNLYVMNADGSGCKEVTYFTYGLHVSSPAWSPDGKYIAFTLQSRNDNAPGGIDTSVMATDLKGFWPVADGMWPCWSHDGKTVLYSAFADSKGQTTDLYERKFAGVGEKKKRMDGVAQAVLSPDGKRLAYISSGNNTGNIVVCNADGSQPKQLTTLNGAAPLGLDWSSNGKRIYFSRPSSPGSAGAVNYRIYVIDADGSNLKPLTEGDAPDYLGAAPGSFLAKSWMDRIATRK